MAIYYFEPAIGINHEKQGCTVPPKYVTTVQASQLSSLLQYQRLKELGTNPIVLASNSFIQIDKDIQRGHANEFRRNLAQDKRKVENIANTLLGLEEEQYAYLGSLIWNVRPADGSLDLVVMQKKDQPPQFKLELSSSKIYLPDSAHRHFGIVEAYRRYCETPARYPKFCDQLCFSVEIYNLDEFGERELFSELNSKQKKITKAKTQMVDTVSPAGRLKSRILTIDNDCGQPLFENNYEETSNNLNNHKLLTMSVFMSSIAEMFTNPELEAAKEDDELSAELATYFCDYFYALRDNLEIAVDLNGKVIRTSPFYNLYNDRIRPVVEGSGEDDQEDVLNKQLEEVVQKAKDYASSIRAQDKTNSNPVIRAFSRVGRTIRHMPNWLNVIKKIQAAGFEQREGKLFQVTNEELIQKDIGKKKPDGTLNIQVQTHTINAIFAYLIELADLHFDPSISVVKTEGVEVPLDSYTQIVKSDQEVSAIVRVGVFVPRGLSIDKDKFYLRIENDRDWKGGTFNTKAKRIACETVQLIDYTHPTYGTDVSRYELTFFIKFPPYNLANQAAFNSSIKILVPRFDGDVEVLDLVLRCQPE
jgi:hypothetical protein